MNDDSAHRRFMIELAQAHLTEAVVVADVFEPPRSPFARGGGIWGLLGLMFAWRDVNRAAGLPPKLLIAVTANRVHFLKVERSLAGWTVRYVLRSWERSSFPLIASTINPAAITIDFSGQQVQLMSVAGSGAAAKELVEMLSASKPPR